MSGDEFAFLIFSILAASYAWYRWYSASSVRVLAVRNASRLIFTVGPVVCLALLWLILRLWAADDVRNSPAYLMLYTVAGAAWVGLGTLLFCLLGISPRDDVVERQNLAAALATAGGLAGLTFCFAGGNIGNGPGWWVVIFSAGLSTGAFFLLWALVEKLTGVSESVTVERDDGSGLRFGGFLVAMGLILGRAAAGDWVSAEATIRDFAAIALPVLPLAGSAVIIERVFRSDTGAPTGGTLTGAFVAAVFVAFAYLYVFVWRGMP